MNNKNNALYSTFCQYISYHNKALSRVSKSQSITQDEDMKIRFDSYNLYTNHNIEHDYANHTYVSIHIY